MQEESKQTLRNLLGLNTASTPVQTVSSVLGGLLFGGGLIGALNENNQQKTFLQSTADTQNRIGQVGVDFGNQATGIQNQLGQDLSAHEAGVEAQAGQGLAARGINNPGMAQQSAGQLSAGTSGAYAMAASALAGAKLNAGRAVSGALSNYQQGIAQKQYESQLAQYYGKMGLWAALGGGGTALLNRQAPSNTKTPNNQPGVDINGYSGSNPTLQGPTTFPQRTVDFSSPFKR